uniref:Tricorn protease N-terminal domain-containing protein n=2 Tax=Vibrio TaxID=662 RepID=A0A0H4A1K6_9VIBR|nr:Tricorn protease N-terminal domain-containing protein [Vibrio genomosp. F6]AKN39631.1 Tricorn protease N-terminal domain-containing protein [Vibrio tasmaniensis]
MKKWLIGLMLATQLVGCGAESAPENTPSTRQYTKQELHPERHYVTESNWYEMVESEKIHYTDDKDRSQIQLFPKYYVYRAKEWPREDLNDASSYDLPRVQFYWANMGDKHDPMYRSYEGQTKIWSMKTDGTDLRLVLDNMTAGGYGKMVRSPDNRYLAYGNGDEKRVYDLKTGETFSLAHGYGMPRFVWTEDSKTLYFADTRSLIYKWDIETKEVVPSELIITDTNVFSGDYRFAVTEGALVKFKKLTNEPLSVIKWTKGLDFSEASSLDRSISPTGKYAWALSRKHAFYVDMEKEEATMPWVTMMPSILGLNGRFGGSKHMTTFTVRDFVEDREWQWRPLGMNRTIEHNSLYNAFANNGLWFKEAK